jgi:hypothetical protein
MILVLFNTPSQRISRSCFIVASTLPWRVDPEAITIRFQSRRPITNHVSPGNQGYYGVGRGCGVGRARGIGLGRGVAVGVGVGVAPGA